MGSPNRTLALLFPLAVVLLGLAWWLGTRSQASSTADDGTALRLDTIQRELAVLRRAVEALAERDETVSPPVLREGAPRLPLTSSPVGDDALGAPIGDWRLALSSVETRLLDELAALREHLITELDRELVPTLIRDGAGEVNWGAWEEVVALWHEDPDRARADVKLLTAEEVLDRFGAPSDVFVNPNGLTWQYARDPDPTTGRPPLEIILRIPDGYVVQLVVRDERR